MNIESKREEFKKLFKLGVTSPVELAITLMVSKSIVIKWINEDFLNTKKSKQFEELKLIKKTKIKFTRKKMIPIKTKYLKMFQLRKYSIVEICKELGISRGTAHKWQRVCFPEGKKWRYNQFVNFYTMGYSLETIQYFLHCSRAAILRYLKRYENSRDEAAKKDVTKKEN